MSLEKFHVDQYVDDKNRVMAKSMYEMKIEGSQLLKDIDLFEEQ